MLSWIFRNRHRLRTIYGTLPPPPLPGARFQSGGSRRGAGLRRSARGRARPGQLWRTTRHVSVRPMPPRVSGD